ncbi:YHYH domain-containing protein [Rhizobium sp.]
MKLIIACLSLVLTCGAVSMAQAHGGGTDRNGCHTNHKTGDYHCH